jgi:DMSO/TMAO reductase YedYZ molybdopterin-dependent catalytic subunit
MTNESARREILKASLAAAALGVLPEWVLPALAQGEVQVPFTDFPANANFAPAADRRVVDIRRIDGPFTPADQFYTIQHYNQPDFNPATYRLSVSGLVDRPVSFSLDDLRRMRAAELIAGFECSGNRRPLQGLCGNGRWTGVPLRAVLDRAGVKNEAREFVFFGADRGKEEVEFRTQKFEVEQQFGRSLPREQALSDEPFLAYALNGEPLTKHQGAPLRLLNPGWYGVSNVKWLSQIHVQAEQYLGKFQARWYRTLKGEMIDGEMKWTETAISRMKVKSFIARVTRDASGHKVLGVVLNDGTPIRSVEVRVDEGPWQRATMDAATNSKYSWKLFTYAWSGATPGEHTLVSRVTDVNGTVQPTAEALEVKKTFLEDNSQYPRKVMIS